MNEERKPTMTKAELEARVEQFRQDLRDAAAAEGVTIQTGEKDIENPQSVPQPTPQPQTTPQPQLMPQPQPASDAETGFVTEELPVLPPEPEAGSVSDSEPEKKHTGLKVLLVIVLAMAVLGFLLTQVFFGILKVDDSGMEETVGKGSYVIFSRLHKTPEIDDVVVIRDEEGSKHVRYVAALKGHIVDYDVYDERLFIDDQPVAKNYSVTDNSSIRFPHTVGGSEVFVLCENRKAADDEGLFPKKSILGKVIFTF